MHCQITVRYWLAAENLYGADVLFLKLQNPGSLRLKITFSSRWDPCLLLQRQQSLKALKILKHPKIFCSICCSSVQQYFTDRTFEYPLAAGVLANETLPALIFEIGSVILINSVEVSKKRRESRGKWHPLGNQTEIKRSSPLPFG